MIVDSSANDNEAAQVVRRLSGYFPATDVSQAGDAAGGKYPANAGPGFSKVLHTGQLPALYGVQLLEQYYYARAMGLTKLDKQWTEELLLSSRDHAHYTRQINGSSSHLASVIMLARLHQLDPKTWSAPLSPSILCLEQTEPDWTDAWVITKPKINLRPSSFLTAPTAVSIQCA